MRRLQSNLQLTHGQAAQLNLQVVQLQGELLEARQAARRVFRYLAGDFGINKGGLISRINTDLEFFGSGNGCLQGDEVGCRGGLGAMLSAALDTQMAADGGGINFLV